MNIVYKTSSKILRAGGNPVLIFKLSVPQIEEEETPFNSFYQRIFSEYEILAKGISLRTDSVTDAHTRTLFYICVESLATVLEGGVIRVRRKELFKISGHERRTERVDLFDIKRGIFIK